MNYVRRGLSRGANLTVCPLLIFLSVPFVAGIIAWAALAPESLLGWVHCPLREVTSIPCPSCGSTFAITCYANGHWQEGVLANPLLALIGVTYVLSLLWTLAVTVVPSWHGEFQFSGREKKAVRWLAALLIVINWVWLLIRC